MDNTTRGLLIGGGILLAVALVLSALSGGMMGAHMGGPGAIGGRGWMWGLGMGLGGLVMLVFWGALMVGIVLLVRSVAGGGVGSHESTPLDVLKRRYAAGEITREQYNQMRSDIEGRSA